MSEHSTDPGEPPSGGTPAEHAPKPAGSAPSGKPAPAALDAEPGAGGYRVSLPSFEGPLDLLLHLIQKHELDILDIPIGFVAQKYVEYLRVMEDLSIDIASEYLLMAATLAYIKSRSLLPPDPSAAEDELLDEEERDPRGELIRRLLEYQKYKQAAEDLGGRSVLGRDVFPRGTTLETSDEPAPLMPLSLFKLVDAFEEVLKRAKRVEEHQVDFERISISDKIGSINELLRQRGTLRFEELFFADNTRAEMIVTFLALLEMTKLRMVHLSQDDALGPITVELRVVEPDDEDFSWTSDATLTSARGQAPLIVSEELEPEDELDEDAAWLAEEADGAERDGTEREEVDGKAADADEVGRALSDVGEPAGNAPPGAEETALPEQEGQASEQLRDSDADDFEGFVIERAPEDVPSEATNLSDEDAAT